MVSTLTDDLDTGITLPMRDWDFFENVILVLIIGLHYLWGIETFDLTASSSSSSDGITLPMRDWDDLFYQWIHHCYGW